MITSPRLHVGDRAALQLDQPTTTQPLSSETHQRDKTARMTWHTCSYSGQLDIPFISAKLLSLWTLATFTTRTWYQAQFTWYTKEKTVSQRPTTSSSSQFHQQIQLIHWYIYMIDESHMLDTDTLQRWPRWRKAYHLFLLL